MNAAQDVDHREYAPETTSTASFSSAFGFGRHYVVVKNNKVVERRYEAFNRQPPVPGAKPNAHETGKDLGKNAGAPVKTLDEWYANAAKVAANPAPKRTPLRAH